MLGHNIVGFLFALAYTLQATAQYSSPCAEECAAQAYDGSECTDPSDYECICSNGSFPNSAYDCLLENCPDEADSGGADYGAACTGVTSTITETDTETTITDAVTSYSGEASTTETDSLVYTTGSSEVISIPSSYTSSSYPSSSYSSSSSSYSSLSYSSSSSSYSSVSSVTPTVPSIYGSSTTPKPSVAASSPPPTPTPAAAGAATRNAMLPVGIVELMAVMVAIAML